VRIAEVSSFLFSCPLINRLSRLFFTYNPAALASISKTNVALNEFDWGSAVSGDPKN